MEKDGGPLQFPKTGSFMASLEMRVAAQAWLDSDFYDDGKQVMGDRPSCPCRHARSNLEPPKPDIRQPIR